MINAANNGDLKTVATLLENMVDPNCKDYDGRTPLHVSAANRHLEIIQLLLDKGADASAKDRFDGTPFDDAVRNKKRTGRDHVVDLLQNTTHQSSAGNQLSLSKIFAHPLVSILIIFQIAMAVLHGFFANYKLTSDRELYPIFQV